LRYILLFYQDAALLDRHAHPPHFSTALYKDVEVFDQLVRGLVGDQGIGGAEADDFEGCVIEEDLIVLDGKAVLAGFGRVRQGQGEQRASSEQQ
jgi:hypothetical protein